MVYCVSAEIIECGMVAGLRMGSHQVSLIPILSYSHIPIPMSGKCYFETTVTDEGLCRVGWSTPRATHELGKKYELIKKISANLKKIVFAVKI